VTVGRREALVGIAWALAAPLACGGKLGGGAQAPANGELLGAQAPDFTLSGPSGGESVGPATFRGKVLVVDFWATWCKPCRESFPVYQRLLDKFSGELAVIGVSVDDDASGIDAFRRETGVKFALVWDQGQAAASVYKPATMPTSYLIDRAGLVKFVHEGFHAGDEAELEQRIRALV
jgi:cytochrome c biogenesis protein CcmG, thiol:disulfide interchange protein DsbE